jgi:hypothetical protein
MQGAKPAILMTLVCHNDEMTKMSASTLFSTLATAQCGAIHTDGRLILTEQALSFEPFEHSLATAPYHWPRSAISSASLCQLKGGGFIPLGVAGIRITLANQSSYQFILANPEHWCELLMTVTH